MVLHLGGCYSPRLSSLIEITAYVLELADVKIYILCMSVKCL